ncbi:C40 family peptidase [Flavobacterium sp. 3HN19-14]|uniref:C40 family peptidase n=1 Tax=Flavobacterium sp. 3HN19-14 TaxID=3448133 RepID=UPI003EDF6CC4
MQTKKLFFFVLTFLALVPFAGSAQQIITSKKEAIKRGIYQKPSEKKTANYNAPVEKASTAIAAKSIEPTAVKPVKSEEKVKPVAKTSKNKKYQINDKEDSDLIVDDSENYVATQMINNAMGFLGVRYHGGGTTPAGMDCSGMVTAVFNIFEMKLPRSSNDMAKVGEKLEKDEIRKGDLIFFHTNGKHIINHVGMVVEVSEDEIKFIHSSTQSGVIISSTKEPYYKKNFVQANRVL